MEYLMWTSVLSYPMPVGLSGGLIGLAAFSAYRLAKAIHQRPLSTRAPDVTSPRTARPVASASSGVSDPPVAVRALSNEALRHRALQLASALTGLQQSWNLASSLGAHPQPYLGEQENDAPRMHHQAADVLRLKDDVRRGYQLLKPEAMAVKDELKHRSLPPVIQQREPTLDEAYENPEARLAPEHWIYNALAADLNYLAGSLPSA